MTSWVNPHVVNLINTIPVSISQWGWLALVDGSGLRHVILNSRRDLTNKTPEKNTVTPARIDAYSALRIKHSREHELPQLSHHAVVGICANSPNAEHRIEQVPPDKSCLDSA